MKLKVNQNGMSTMSLLSILLIAAFFLMCAFKLIPLYLEAWTVDGAMKRAVQEGGFSGQPASQIRKSLSKTFELNTIDAITPKDVKITKQKNGLELDASYHKQVPLIYNIDVVVKFDNLKYEVSK